MSLQPDRVWSTVMRGNSLWCKGRNIACYLSYWKQLSLYVSFPTRRFPSGPSLQGSRFHIGSRGKWKGLYSVRIQFTHHRPLKCCLFPPNIITLAFILPCEQGLLRQLVLVPGSDATQHICPSLMPQLAALSVPPLLLDESHRGSNEEDQGIYQSNVIKNCPAILIPLFIWPSSHICVFLKLSAREEQVSVGLQRSCTEQIKGQLWFNPLRKGLYLCDGTVWITVLEGGNQLLPFCSRLLPSFCSAHLDNLSFCLDHKRLDYLLEHQIITTSSETHDVEVFMHFLMGRTSILAMWSQFDEFSAVCQV